MNKEINSIFHGGIIVNNEVIPVSHTRSLREFRGSELNELRLDAGQHLIRRNCVTIAEKRTDFLGNEMNPPFGQRVRGTDISVCPADPILDLGGVECRRVAVSLDDRHRLHEKPFWVGIGTFRLFRDQSFSRFSVYR